MAFTVCLAGNPNCGKTTLFNALTGSDMRVGNWPGVTVERLEGFARVGEKRMRIVDLPGTYSLTPYSVEERITREYIDSGEADAVLAVADAGAARRGMYLVAQLMERGLNVVLAVNMMDEMEKRGVRPDIGRLGRMLGIRAAGISARSGRGMDELTAMLTEAAESPVRPKMAARTPEARYEYIDRVLDTAGFPKGDDGDTPSEKIDRAVMHPYLAFPLCFAALGAVFFVTFGPVGNGLRGLAESMVAVAERGCGLLTAGSPAWLRSLLTDGVIAGVGSVLTFLPQLLLMFGCLAFLEDSGCMARLAFIADRPLRALGLSGRSFIPMLMGFGCTTAAAAAARGVEAGRDRKMTLLLLPFVSCGARMPVYALMAAAVFPERPGLLAPMMVMLGIAVMALCGALLRKTLFREGESPFLMEIPEYRLPTVKSAARRVAARTREFMARAGTVIFCASVVIWALRYFTPGLTAAEGIADSMLGKAAGWISPVFKPLGFGDAGRCAALITGLIAKEAVVSTLQIVYAPGTAALSRAARDVFTPPAALAFSVFVLLYTPCVSALAAMRRELGSRRLLALGVGMQMAAAYGCALLTYRIGAFVL